MLNVNKFIINILDGEDWSEEFDQCTKGQQAPIIINSADKKPLKKDTYCFPDLKKDVTGEFHLEDDGNNLVLNFETKNNTLGYVGFKDNFGENYFICNSIYFRIPGEFQYDGKSPDMSLQVYCKTSQPEKPGTKIAFFNIPVTVVDVGEKQSVFFDEIEEIRKDSITAKDLPIDLTIHKWGDLLDALIVYDELYQMDAKINFPPCKERAFWFYAAKPQKIKKELLEQLTKCLDNIKCPYGNNRINAEKGAKVDLKYYEH